MRPRRWFLPQTPDVLGMLRKQIAITVDGMDALTAWARGDAGAADRVRADEHQADRHKRELREALTVAFTAPLALEDLFELSRELDEILNGAKDTVREAEVMGVAPDLAMAEMAERLTEGTRHLAAAFDALADSETATATASADEAVASQRRMEKVYRNAMSALIDVDDLHEVTARRELYRRLARLSEGLIDVSERVWYSVLKQS